MNTHQNPANNVDRKIDSALRLFAQAQPPANLEQRIHARLHSELEHTHANFLSTLSSFFFAQRIVLASAAAALACCAIVIGSVQHSRQRVFPATGVHVSAPGSGLGAASGTRIAPQPVPVPENAHSRSERKATGGRATVSRDTHKPKGVAVPQSTEPEKP
jgi:hypothetical protein